MGRKSLIAAIVAAVVAAACVGGAVYVAYMPTTGTQQVVIATPSSGVSSPSTTAQPATTTSPVVPELPHDFVAQAVPTSFSIVCGDTTLVAPQGVTTTVRALQASYVEAGTNTKVNEYYLDIQGDTVALVKDSDVPWAAMPGSDAGTVAIWGHADTRPMVFNPIAQFTGDPSSCKATVAVPGGVLRYRFVEPHVITPKRDEFNWSATMANRRDVQGNPLRGVLLAVTCLDADSEVAWEFALESSQAN